MNRRDFMKWLGRLLAALPFVALTDWEQEHQTEDIILTFEPIDVWSQSPVETGIKWMPDGETIHSISLLPWDVDAPYEEVEHLSNILQQAEDSVSPRQYYIWKK